MMQTTVETFFSIFLCTIFACISVIAIVGVIKFIAGVIKGDIF